MSTRETGAARMLSATLAALIAVVSLFAGLPAAAEPPSGSPGAPVLDPTTRDYARLRITATANSGWAVATFSGLEIIDHVFVSGPPVMVSPTSFSWIMGTDASPPVVLDVLVSSPVGVAVSLTTIKGDAGTFTIDADSIATTDVASDAFEHVNDQVGVAGNNPLTTPMPRELLISAHVEVGPIDDERLVMTMVHPWWDGDELDAIGPDKPLITWEYDEAWQLDVAIEMMVFARIDVALYSYGWPGYESDPLIDNLLTAARTDGRVQVAPVIEVTAARDWNNGGDPLDYLASVIDSAMADVAANPGLFLQRDGRPVVFFYADWILDTGQWNELLTRAASRGHNLFPITHVEDADRQTDGYWEYIGPPGQNEAQYTEHARARTMRGRVLPILRPTLEPRLVVGSVWPGYDDSSQQDRTVHRNEPRNGGEFYNSRWRAALEGLPDWVVVTSWNEWWEQTHISPSFQSETLPLWQTYGWSSWFHLL